MSMTFHDFAQGSDAWHQHRATHFNASDAPAMMGCSPYMTRTELLTRLKTGISAEVDAATQRRFDDGHRFEALARPLAEKIIGQELYPVTGSNGDLSASFDGLTDGIDGPYIAFEHKTLNDDLRSAIRQQGGNANDFLAPVYRIQMEQQMLVSGAERVLFMASKWNGDELVEERHCWYTSDADLRAKLIAGWQQFAQDLAGFVPESKAAPVVAAPVETLPAVSVKVDGALAIVSNLPDFGAALRSFIDKIPDQPSTDQEFADTEAACKALKKAEEALDAAETNALAQLTDVDTMRRFVADYKALARTTRLQKEKLVAARKEAIKGEIVAEGVAAFAAHIRSLNAAMPANYMPQVPADFGGSIKGLKSVDSIRNAVSTELANAKIRANEIANLIHTNIGQLDAANAPHLFSFDIAGLVLKNPDDLANVIALRINGEKQRKEAERERIRAEEAARLEREAAARAAAEKAEADRVERERAHAAQVEADRIARELAEAAGPLTAAEVVEADAGRGISEQGADAFAFAAQAAGFLKPQERQPIGQIIGLDFASKPDIGTPADDGARLSLGQINERLSPVCISVAGLSDLGYEPVAVVKAARLYRSSDFKAICAAISAHVLAAPVKALEAA